MKKLLLILSICSLFLATGCGDDEENYLFEIHYNVPFEIPSGQNPSLAIVIPYDNLSNDIHTELTNMGRTIDDVTSINTSRARLDLNSFNGDLSVFNEITVNVFDQSNFTAPGIEAAYTIEIRDRVQTQLDLVPSLANLKEAFEQPTLNMEMVLEWRRTNAIQSSGILSISFGVIE